MSGLALADPALARAVGSEAKLSLQRLGFARRRHRLRYARARRRAISTRAIPASSRRRVVRGRLEVTARDLSRFAPLAGDALKGEARLTADLDGAPRYGALNATLDAHATKLVTDYPLLDQRHRRRSQADRRRADDAGRRLRLHRPRGERARTGRRGSTANYASDKVDIDARIDVPQVQVVDPRVIGRAAVVGRADRDARRSRRKPQGDPQRRPAARSQNLRPRARG